MGKGDWRRPSQVSREEEAKRWEEAFGTGPKLNIMTPEELAELREPDGGLTVTCEFCSRKYRFT